MEHICNTDFLQKMGNATLCNPPEGVLKEMVLKHSIIFPDSIIQLQAASSASALPSQPVPPIAGIAQTSAIGLHSAACTTHMPSSSTLAQLPGFLGQTNNPVNGYQHYSTQVEIPFNKAYPCISAWLPALDADPNHNSPSKPQQYSSLAPQFKAENMKTIDEIILLGFEQMHSLLGIKVGCHEIGEACKGRCGYGNGNLAIGLYT